MKKICHHIYLLYLRYKSKILKNISERINNQLKMLKLLYNAGVGKLLPAGQMRPQSQNLRPASSFSAKNIHFNLSLDFILKI